MTAEIGGRGDRHQQQVEGGQREGSSLLEEEEGGVEVPSKIKFLDPRFTLTSNPYCTKNRCTQKFISVISGEGITNFTPVQVKAFVPVLVGRDAIEKS